jgi:hypothetical protein
MTTFLELVTWAALATGAAAVALFLFTRRR